MTEHQTSQSGPSSAPAHRYTADLANAIEAKWRARWDERGVFHTPNPTGPLSDGFERERDRPKLYVLDMFPYPSGAGLHVGHPLGYIATDIFGRYKRMAGWNVLHAMGYDAFGLPAEQYAVQTGQHPRATTERNIASMRQQLHQLGLAHDPRRSVATTDVSFYKWTQWIFLQIYNAWWDADARRARPIGELIDEFESGRRFPESSANPENKPWEELSEIDRRRVVDSHRLAYLDEVPVNWCPALGTVLANEEVTAEGRSERGDHPVYKRPLRQWMMRITKYADRLLDDLDLLDWPEPIKLMQRNWIGRSEGATVEFPLADDPETKIRAFTTRPDTLFGATYMVLAPEHPLVERLASDAWPAGTRDSWKVGADSPRQAVRDYARRAAEKSEVQRLAESKEKSGVFIGAFAVNPASGQRLPIFVADYVLMAYGTGAIMAVPAHDQRDFAFARQFDLPIRAVVEPDEQWLSEQGSPDPVDARTWPDPFEGEGRGVNSANKGVSLNGKPTGEAKRAITEWLESQGLGERTVTYKLRDWLFSRQRYWGEPFPIVYDENDLPVALPESMLPVELPDLDDFAPEASEDPDAPPKPPLARAKDWAQVELDLGDGKKMYRRETNTMPQWAGSCWYYLRYLDPTNEQRFCDPAVERYWMRGPTEQSQAKAGGVDLYVGGVEHAVLHLLYARFWHKVLYDLGHVSTPEPFQKLFNQGYIQAPAYRDRRGVYVEASEVEERDGQFFHHGEPVTREYGKMGKSLKNAITPDEVRETYGADSLRLYEMYMGPLEQSKSWDPRDIVGVFRFLQRLWRNIVDEQTGDLRVADEQPDDETRRRLHKTIAGVREDLDSLEFNTAIAKLIEFNNHLTQRASEAGSVPREVAEALTLLVAPLAPHIAEELWERLGRSETTILRERYPEADESLLKEEQVEIPVQVMGKVRGRITAPTEADQQTLERLALADENVRRHIEGKTVRKVIVVPGRLVNIVAK